MVEGSEEFGICQECPALANLPEAIASYQQNYSISLDHDAVVVAATLGVPRTADGKVMEGAAADVIRGHPALTGRKLRSLQPQHVAIRTTYGGEDIHTEYGEVSYASTGAQQHMQPADSPAKTALEWRTVTQVAQVEVWHPRRNSSWRGCRRGGWPQQGPARRHPFTHMP